MKIILSSFLLLVFIGTSTAQEFKSPAEYMNYMSAATDAIAASMTKYTSEVVHSNNPRKIEPTRTALLKNILAAKMKVEAVENGYKDDTEYRDQLVIYLTLSENYLNDQYEEILKMHDVAAHSLDGMETYMRTRDMINGKIREEIDKLNAAQKSFANKYGVTIDNRISELATKMKISNAVFEYHTEVYLVYFRSSATESDLLKAVEAKDVSAIQQNVDALAMYADNGILELQDLKAFKKDSTLLIAAGKTMEFFKNEATELGPLLVSFYTLDHKLQQLKKTIENKAPKDVTKEEMADYNTLLEESSKAAVEYNKQVAKFNAARAASVKVWNDASVAFLTRHIPKE